MTNINFIDRAAASTVLITTVVMTFASNTLATTLTGDSTSTNRLSVELTLELQRELDQVVRETGVPGATLAIMRDHAERGSFADRFFTPLELNNTFFAPTEEIVGNQTRRYLDLFQADVSLGQDGIPDDITYVNPSLFWANGSIFANALDVAQFFDRLFGGEVLQPESIDEMLTFVDTGLVINYGLGVFALETPWGTAWTTPGDYPGSGSTPYYLPDLDLIIVALGNQSFADEDSRDEYRRTIISNSLNTLLEVDSQSVSEPNSVVGLILLGAVVLFWKLTLPTHRMRGILGSTTKLTLTTSQQLK